MFSRNLMNTYKLRWLRLFNISLSNAEHFHLSRKSLLNTNYGCIASTYSHYKSLIHRPRERKSNRNDGRQYSEEKMYAKIYSFIPAFIIILLGIEEASCEEDVVNESIIQPKSKPNSELPEEEGPENIKVDENVPKEESIIEPESKPKNELPKNKDTKNIKVKAKQENKISDKILPTLPNKPNKISDKILPTLPNKPSKNEKASLRVQNHQDPSLTLKNAIDWSRNYLNGILDESGAPGISVSVSINGKNVWSEGIGFSDIENGVRMSPYTVMRIASISKSLTMVAVCQLVEEGKLDLDAPVQKYVPSFPKKVVDGEEVTITTRHLLNHTSGIRHYKLKGEYNSKKVQESLINNKEVNNDEKEPKMNLNPEEKRRKIRELVAEKAFRPKEKENDDDQEYDLEEYYIKESFKSVKEALQLFQDDELLFKPGEGRTYTTHGWTLVSAVIEGASGKSFTTIMVKLFHNLAMPKTFLDKNEPIIYLRSRYYFRDRHGKLKNAPYVDNSYKWAGGGILSNVIDLINFGNVMLYSYQSTKDQDQEQRGFLKSSTMRKIWTPSPDKKIGCDTDGHFALGWFVMEGDKYPKAFAYRRNFSACHTGGAIGASSVLLIMPTCEQSEIEASSKLTLPQGIVVSIMTNMHGVGLKQKAVNIAKLFERVHLEPKVVGTIGGNKKHNVYNLDTS